MLGRAGFDALGFAIGSERGGRFVVWEHTALGRPAWPILVLGLVPFLVSAQLLEDSITRPFQALKWPQNSKSLRTTVFDRPTARNASDLLRSRRSETEQ
jgi:hypothetical protein